MYTDVAHFKATGPFTPSATSEMVEDFGDFSPIVEAQMGYIDSRLYLRYAVPFAEPVPQVVKRWCVALVAEQLMVRRGSNADSGLAEDIRKSADIARAELSEAAAAEKGLFDIPLNKLAVVASGIERSNPLSYSEASPYDFIDVERENVRR